LLKQSREEQYALVIVFLVLSVVLVGIPAMFFTGSIFFANMYERLVEKRVGSSL